MDDKASDARSRLERMNPSAEMLALIEDLKKESRKLAADELQAGAVLAHHGFARVYDGVGGAIIIEWIEPEAANQDGLNSLSP